MENTAQLSTRDVLPWYALRIQSRLAGVTLESLQAKGYETFLPMYSSQKRWSDRVKHIGTPLFPGYLFCRFDRRAYLPVITAPGVSSILGTGNIPIAVEEDEIAAVRWIVQSGLRTEVGPFLPAGTNIRLTHGPLAGLEGILMTSAKLDRLVVSVTLLNRSVSVEIDYSWAKPLPKCSIGMPKSACAKVLLSR